MKLIKKIRINRENEIDLRIFVWHGEYGRRFGYALDVAEVGPFAEALGNSCGDGFISAAEAEREGREMWRSFRTGDELVRGVFVVNR